MIGCATCSLSQRLMQQVLLPCLILTVSSCSNPHVCFMVGHQTRINSVDTLLYPYALPLEFYSLNFSNLCLSCNLSSSLRSLHYSSDILTKYPNNSMDIYLFIQRLSKTRLTYLQSSFPNKTDILFQCWQCHTTSFPNGLIYQVRNISRRGNYLQENYKRHQKRYENIIQYM